MVTTTGKPAKLNILDSDWKRSRLVVSPDEAAAILGVSRATIFREMQAGSLASMTIGGTRSRRISVTSLQRYVEGQDNTERFPTDSEAL